MDCIFKSADIQNKSAWGTICRCCLLSLDLNQEFMISGAGMEMSVIYFATFP
jgi:hypothetical protein